ncbi:hypothetical protein EVAR_10031_1 [Eumeta japonica]|uniref:Uncharacterized protein n=1 Tax=Eumeta variegata TaxID=151549 RepID=A0A4C1TR42_EUMVA|nr:hypothetical protein EVAR_10031_1 [Eumeta japonica]
MFLNLLPLWWEEIQKTDDDEIGGYLITPLDSKGSNNSLHLLSAVEHRAQRRGKSRYSELKNVSQEQSTDAHKILHDCRGRKRVKACEQINDGASTPAAGATETMQVDGVIAYISALNCIDIDMCEDYY